MLSVKSFREAYLNLLNSSTVMTWLNLSSGLLNTVVVLPLLLTKFNTAEIALWYLFSSIIIIQTIAGIGFSDTFSRVFSFAYGGASVDELHDLRNVSRKERCVNWDTVGEIWATISWIYARLSILVFALYLTIGPILLNKNIALLNHPSEGWISYTIIVVCSTIQFFGNRYNIYLTGMNHVALVNRWGATTSILAILTSFIVLHFNGSIVSLVIANQVWNVISVIRNFFLCRQVENGIVKEFKDSRVSRVVFEAVWPSAWRSGVGLVMSSVIVNASGLIYAQIANVREVASYLLGFRLIQTVVAFSLAPFYSKLPLLARLRAEGKIGEQIEVAKKGMQLAYWTYVLGFLCVGVLADFLLTLIKSNARFVSSKLWCLMGFAFLIERYGAMHIQLYSTTNHIIWHKANGVTGCVYLILSFGLIKYIGAYSFPVAMIISNLSFYSWYSAKYSYASTGLRFAEFEMDVSAAPLLFFVITTFFLW